MENYKQDIDASVEIYKKNCDAFNHIYTNMMIKEGLSPSSEVSLYDMFYEITANYLRFTSPHWLPIARDVELFIIGVGIYIIEKHKLTHLHLQFDDDYELALAMRSYEMTKKWMAKKIKSTIMWPEIRKEDYET